MRGRARRADHVGAQPRVVTVTVERLVAGGSGLGRLADGRVVFVDGTLAGERVRAEILSEARDYVTASVSEVSVASPDRRPPPCPAVAVGCGGCAWQHLEPSAQLAAKVGIVAESLARTARLTDCVVSAGRAVPADAYRTTVRAAVAPDGRLGLRARRSHHVVPFDHCLVVHPLLDEMLVSVRVDGPREVSARVSAATQERTIMALGGRPPTWRSLAGGVTTGDHAAITERVAGVDLRVSAPSFFQSGPAAAELLVDAVGRAAGDLAAAPMIDAYGGIGLFAATVGRGPITVVESSPSACADARHNLAGRDARVCESAVESWTPVPAELVVADPARTGLQRAGVATLAAACTARLVLVSCDPVAMARDARLLVDAGFGHVRSEVLDLFPHTPHVEVVTVFERR